MLVDIVNKLLGIGIILSQLFIVAAVLYVIFFRKHQYPLVTFIKKHGLTLAFSTVLISVLGSLFYSQIAGFAPCDLCWFQRIFMYPLVLLLGIALWRKDSRIADYGLILAIIGGLISLYHNYVYYYNRGLNVFCQLGGAQVSCIKRYVFEFGYITIPMMALTAFALVIIFLLAYKVSLKKL
jgi:disulfide bond formation protein DsbB